LLVFFALYGWGSDGAVEEAGAAMSEAAQYAFDAVGDATDSNVDC